MHASRRSARHTFVLLALCVAGAGLAAACSSGTSTSTTSQITPGSTAPSTPGAPVKVLNANGVDLKGTWSSTDRESRSLDGLLKTSEVMTVTQQEGATFVVSRDLELDRAYALGDEGPPTKKVTGQPMLGVVNVDGSITIVKKGDAGQLNGWLTDANTMVLSYSEAGIEPAVARVTLVRATPTSTAGSVPSSTAKR